MGTKKVIGLVAAALIAGLVLGSFGIAQAGSTAAKKQVAAQSASATVACPNAANGTCAKAADGTCPTDGQCANGGACATGGACANAGECGNGCVPQGDRRCSRRGSVSQRCAGCLRWSVPDGRCPVASPR